MAGGVSRRMLPVDGHAHFHQCFRLDEWLDHAAAAFRLAAGEHRAVIPGRGVLCVVRPDPGPPLGRIRERASSTDTGEWELSGDGGDRRTLTARHRRRGDVIAVVAGRQVATTEGLEVLALGTDRPVPRRGSLARTVRGVGEAGGVPVIPWGFGKWWFARGRVLRSLLRAADPSELFLGDNAGRLPMGPHLSVLGLARSLGVGVLPGSDPLPLAGHERRVGRFGFLLPSDGSGREGAAWLVKGLRELEGQPGVFGRLDPPLTALASQLRLRLPG